MRSAGCQRSPGVQRLPGVLGVQRLGVWSRWNRAPIAPGIGCHGALEASEHRESPAV